MPKPFIILRANSTNSKTAILKIAEEVVKAYDGEILIIGNQVDVIAFDADLNLVYPIAGDKPKGD